MRIATSFAVCLALLGTGQQAGATLVLATDFPSGSPLMMNAGSPSTAMTVSTYDSTTGSLAADNLSGYQVSLQIVPQGGATGSLTFATPTTSGSATEPANYIFAAVNNAGLNVTNLGGSLFFFDFNDPYTGGVDVPDGAGSNLVAMTFNASLGTSGLFDIVADREFTEWTDSASPTQMARFFTNVPSGTGTVVIGQVQVAPIPEPSGAIAITVLLVIGGLCQFRRRAAH